MPHVIRTPSPARKPGPARDFLDVPESDLTWVANCETIAGELAREPNPYTGRRICVQHVSGGTCTYRLITPDVVDLFCRRGLRPPSGQNRLT